MIQPLPLGASVRILHLVDPPTIVRTRVMGSDGNTLSLELESDAALPVGARVVLEIPDAARPRALAEIAVHDGRHVEVRMGFAAPADRREYPRFRGWIGLRWRHGDADAAEAWLQGGDVPGEEHAPHPSMDVSATGLAFDDLPHMATGDLLLLSLEIPGEPMPRRALARVVQVRPLTPGELVAGVGATHRVAIALEPAARDAVAALARYTLRVQQAMVEGRGRPPSMSRAV